MRNRILVKKLNLLLLFILLRPLIIFSQNESIGIMNEYLKKSIAYDKLNIKDSVNYYLDKINEVDRINYIDFSNTEEVEKRELIFEQSLELLKNNNTYTGLLNKATFYSKLKQYDNAFNTYKFLTENYNVNFVIYYNISKLLERIEKFEKALQYSIKAIELNDKHPTLYLNQGFLLVKLKRYGEAITVLEKALNLSKQTQEKSFIYNNLGFAYLKKGELSLALMNVNKSIELYNENSYSFKNLGLIYLEQKEYSKACDTFKKSRDLGFETLYGNEVNDLIKNHCD